MKTRAQILKRQLQFDCKSLDPYRDAAKLITAHSLILALEEWLNVQD